MPEATPRRGSGQPGLCWRLALRTMRNDYVAVIAARTGGRACG
jgi:hypothetical protein